jgi:prolyl-tRNA editing enzyme YbaK/EbsC (Cys-tRNA(Pro) deacylase)
MPLPTLGDLSWVPALERPELLAASTYAALVAWAASEPMVATDIAVAAIDATLADTAAFVAAYRVPMTASVNCVVIQGRRGEAEPIAAAAIRADMRADVNVVVKRLLDARKCSFMGLDEAVARSAMEYGGITPIGVPDGWRVLVDASVSHLAAVVIGSGIRGSKLLLPGALLSSYPGAEVIDGLAYPGLRPSMPPGSP